MTNKSEQREQSCKRQMETRQTSSKKTTKPNASKLSSMARSKYTLKLRIRKTKQGYNVFDCKQVSPLKELTNVVKDRSKKVSKNSKENLSSNDNAETFRKRLIKKDKISQDENSVNLDTKISKVKEDRDSIRQDKKQVEGVSSLTSRSSRNKIKRPMKEESDKGEDVDSDFDDYQIKPHSKKFAKKMRKVFKTIESGDDSGSGYVTDIDDAVDNTNVSSDDGSDWEEVPDIPYYESAKRRNLKPVEVSIHKKKRSKKSKIEQAMDEIRRRINRKLIIYQDNAHKVHLLCLMSLAFRMNSIGCNAYFKAYLLSMVPTKFLKVGGQSSWDFEAIKDIRDWFLETFSVEILANQDGIARYKVMADVIISRKLSPLLELEYLLIFIATCRSIGLDTRLLYSLQPLSYKATDLLKPKPLSAKFLKSISVGGSEGNSQDAMKIEMEKLQEDEKKISENSVDKVKPTQQNKSKAKQAKIGKKKEAENYDESIEGDDDDDDDDDDKSNDKKSTKRGSTSQSRDNKPNKRAKKSGVSELGNKSVASLKNGTKKPKDACDWWAEVYLESMSSWITVTGPKLVLDKIEKAEKRVTKPISYILAFDTNNHVKDLTRKYDSSWLKLTSKSRLDGAWWSETLDCFDDDQSDKSIEEDLQIHDALLKKPFPVSISEYKNHPLYALQRHLLKYQAIYPPCSVVLGYVRNEPIFVRESVHTLCSKQKWLIEGRKILPDQEPYKFVKALPRCGKQKRETNEMLGLYGMWQTELYIGPEAVNGRVPKNDFKNVDLFKPWMLPQHTVHLKGTYHGMGKAARKAGIDAAPAMVGWEFHKGHNHPILDGWVVCKENVVVLMDAWRKEQEMEREKREQRALSNWKRLVKLLMLRNKLMNQFKIMNMDEAAKKRGPRGKRRGQMDSDSDESHLSFQTVSQLSDENKTTKRKKKK